MRRGLSQEQLKGIACVSMLLDHIGVVLFPGAVWLRAIGRLAFPIYCFLLVEGFGKTKNRRKYALRLLIGAILAEIPYDLALHGGVCWQRQNVMLTLLLGFGMLWYLEEKGQYWCVILAALTAQVLGADYGGFGIVLIAVFCLTREREDRGVLQAVLMGLCFFAMDGGKVTVQLFALASIPLIRAYSGRKTTQSRALQWGFYLFYPAHLLGLYWISAFMIG